MNRRRTNADLLRPLPQETVDALVLQAMTTSRAASATNAKDVINIFTLLVKAEFEHQLRRRRNRGQATAPDSEVE